MKVSPQKATQKQIEGNKAEARAEAFLLARGFSLLERNFLCKVGEIDLLMRDGNCLVFVEVRFRKNANFGSALETVNHSKQKKLIAAAQFYLSRNPLPAGATVRFDVIGITGDDIQWVVNAFHA